MQGGVIQQWRLGKDGPLSVCTAAVGQTVDLIPSSLEGGVQVHPTHYVWGFWWRGGRSQAIREHLKRGHLKMAHEKARIWPGVAQASRERAGRGVYVEGLQRLPHARLFEGFLRRPNQIKYAPTNSPLN